jgi:hypothetical protein
MFRKGLEMRDGSYTATVLRELVKTSLELVQSSETKQVDLAAHRTERVTI